jgi:hypothetical protein
VSERFRRAGAFSLDLFAGLEFGPGRQLAPSEHPDAGRAFMGTDAHRGTSGRDFINGISASMAGQPI